ncbi:uncharacterized protein [Paramisgurnus dabryanus]|uniref:uncharacterized protein n=1 Tax=Paramisgurnus dabryanus TaxID=90735 RepID=UPI003CCF020D
MNPESTDEVNLICDSSCNLTSENYYWYKNEQLFAASKSLIVSSRGNTDSYSCSQYIYGKNTQSSSVCLSNSGCWGVTYTSTRVCALVGSTVDIHSSYSHPTGYTVKKTYWDYIDIKFKDLREVHQFAGHVEFVGNTLRIKDVNTSDCGIYRFRIVSNTLDEFSGSSGVFFTVTDTQVISSPNPVIDGEKVILSCSTECTLDYKHTYIWYKNGQQVTDGLRLLNKLYLKSINSEELQEYSCTVRETISVFCHLRVCLLVFLPQFLILGALWIWFFISKNKLKSKNRTDDKHEENQMVHMSVCRSAELLE